MSNVQSKRTHATPSHATLVHKTGHTTAHKTAHPSDPAKVQSAHEESAQEPAAATEATTSAVLSELRALQAKLKLRPRLTKKGRQQLVAAAKTTPTGLIDAVVVAATATDGTVAGVAFDATTARAALARSPEATSIVLWALNFAQIVADDDLRDRAAVGKSAMRVYGLLAQYVQSPEGAALLGPYEQMREIMRSSRNVGAAKATKAKDVAAIAEAAGARATPTPVSAPKGGTTGP